ncbi:MAG: phosphoribosylanthranilate isomerase [Lachnospiraceae bacterium]|nr:phosphoribosylanthranilate isomerase [Lachnospiraceae bacterium]
MTKIKLCGLKRECDIAWANELQPEYVGFVFAKESSRYVTPKEAAMLKSMLSPSIQSVGVFVDADIEMIAAIAERGIIDVVQLHGNEEGQYLESLRKRTKLPILQAFRVRTVQDVQKAGKSRADMVLLDAGAGCGEVFDWSLLGEMNRPYFLAGGLTPQNVENAVKSLKPYGVDASSSLETGGVKDKEKMTAFVESVRGKDDENDRSSFGVTVGSAIVSHPEIFIRDRRTQNGIFYKKC